MTIKNLFGHKILLHKEGFGNLEAFEREEDSYVLSIKQKHKGIWLYCCQKTEKYKTLLSTWLCFSPLPRHESTGLRGSV